MPRQAIEPALLTAAQVMQWRSRGQPLPALGAVAVITHQPWLLPGRRPWVRRRQSTVFSFDYVSVGAMGREIPLVLCSGIGAPGVAVAIEELAVAGVRRIISLDIAGSLDGSAKSRDVVLVSSALATDGTSKLYGGGPIGLPDSLLTERLRERLSERGLPIAEGVVWSTDGVYRETAALVRAAVAQQAVLVDMETAAVLAVSAAAGIEAAAVLVAADRLLPQWQPPDDIALVQRRLRQLLPVIISVLTP